MSIAFGNPPMYLPFVEKAKAPAMGLKPLAVPEWIEIDQDFISQLARKDWLLANRYEDVFVAEPDSQPAQQEVLDLLVEHLLQYFPTLYQTQPSDAIGETSDILNVKTGQLWHLQDFKHAPLDLGARLVQEDLSLMMPGEQGYSLFAASVCFPQRWNLREKLGLPMTRIHHKVPSYAQKLSRPVDSVFDRLKEDYPGLRYNWSLLNSPELHLQSGKHIDEPNPDITPENAGKKLWLRVERQTIRRMPISRGVLFTIRTYRYPLAQVTALPNMAARLLEAVHSLPLSMQTYKSLLPFKPALLSYLERCAHESHEEATEPELDT